MSMYFALLEFILIAHIWEWSIRPEMYFDQKIMFQLKSMGGNRAMVDTQFHFNTYTPTHKKEEI